MLTLQVLGLGPLRNSIFPLLAVGNRCGLKCSPNSVSFIVSYPDQSHRFIAALQIFDPFFTIFSSSGAGNYIPGVDIHEFYRLLLKDDFYLTILIPRFLSYANFILSNKFGDFRSFTSLGKINPQHGEPQNENAGQFDHNLFVAIDAAKFRETATQLSVHNAPIHVIASTSRVRFYVTETATGRIIREIVLTTQGRECLAGGFDDRVHEIKFSFTLDPKDFFLLASHLTNLVWFFKSTDWRTTVICFTGEWINILGCYPAISVNLLLHSFSLNEIRRSQRMPVKM